MMLEYITGYDVVAEAKMVRSAFPGSILIVEGDDDILFFEKFTNPDECKLLPARGKENVLTAISLLDKEEFRGMLGIVDADFWHITPPYEIPVRICVTDHHDLETMIIESQALINVLNEYGSQEKIKAFIEGMAKGDIRKTLYEITFPFGTLRLISASKELRLKFTNLPYDRVMNKDNLEVNINKLIRAIYEASECQMGENDLRDIFDKMGVEYRELDRSQLCCGDDLIAIICIGLRKLLGTLDKKIASRRIVASALRLSYDSKDLQTTALYACVKQWEVVNSPYKVFNI